MVAALLLHAIVIFGIRFVQPEIHSAGMLEVTLVPAESATAPKRADFLAQAQQTGSGTLAQARLLSAPERTPLPGTGDKAAVAARLAGAPLSQTNQITSTQGETRVKPLPTKTPADAGGHDQLAALDAEISTLQARLSASYQAQARAPRIRTLSAVSTQADVSAAYVEHFRERVEASGNARFPAQARAEKLQGQVRLLVALQPNGQVQRIQVLHSSGYRLLDEAAQQSVRQSQPFGHFSPAMRDQFDILQIVRTWRFAETLDTEQ